MAKVEVGGLRIAYERAGAGPALVLLHGFVGDARSTWSGQFEELADEFTVVAWDAPGVGGSSDPPESFRSADYADCLAGFVDALGLAQPHLVGLSFGGVVVLELVGRRPDIPKSLVLAGAYAGWAGSMTRDAVEQRLRYSLEVSELPPDQFVAAMLPSMFSESAPRKYVDSFAATVLEFRPAGFRTMARATAEADLRDVLGRIEQPTLVLSGDRDVRAPLPVAQALHTAIPGSRLVVLPGVGHVSSVEAPELFNREVRDFLHSVEEPTEHGRQSGPAAQPTARLIGGGDEGT